MSLLAPRKEPVSSSLPRLDEPTGSPRLPVRCLPSPCWTSVSSDTLRCRRYRTTFVELSAATNGDLGSASGRSSVPSRSRLLLASTPCDVLSLQLPRRCIGSPRRNRHDDSPRCGSGGLSRGSGLRRAPTPCGALAAVPPSPSLSRLRRSPFRPDSGRSVRSLEEGFLRFVNVPRRPRAAELGSPIRKRSGYPRPGPRALPLPVRDFDRHRCLAAPPLLAQPSPNLERLRVVALGPPSAARPFPWGQGRGEEERSPASSLRSTSLFLRWPQIQKTRSRFRSSRGRLSPFSKGRLRSAGPPCGVPPSRTTGGAVNLCSRSSCSPTGASWASGRSVFLSTSILRFDRRGRQSGKERAPRNQGPGSR